MFTDFSSAGQPSIYSNTLAVLLIALVAAYTPWLGLSLQGIRAFRNGSGGKGKQSGAAVTRQQSQSLPGGSESVLIDGSSPSPASQQQQFHILALFMFLFAAAEAMQLAYTYNVYSNIGPSGYFRRMSVANGMTEMEERMEDAALVVAYLICCLATLVVGRRSSRQQHGSGPFKSMCALCGVLGAIGCALRFTSSFGTQLVARGVLGGASSGLLIVGFEGWLVAISGGTPQRHELLSSIHASMLHVACLVAVPSCLISQVLATTCNTPFAPFVCAAVLYSIGVVCVLSEAITLPRVLSQLIFNNGLVAIHIGSSNSEVECISTSPTDENATAPVASPSTATASTFALALQQTTFEICVFLLCFSWTPSLEPPIPEYVVGMPAVPYGIVCCCVMLAFILGRALMAFVLSPSAGKSMVEISQHFASIAAMSGVLALTVMISRRRDVRFITLVWFFFSFGIHHNAVGTIREIIAAPMQADSHNGGTSSISARISRFILLHDIPRLCALFIAAIILSAYGVASIMLEYDHDMGVSDGKMGMLLYLPVISAVGLLIGLQQTTTTVARRRIVKRWPTTVRQR